MRLLARMCRLIVVLSAGVTGLVFGGSDVNVEEPKMGVSVAEYLAQARVSYLNAFEDRGVTVDVVMGNEASDLDSIAGAIARAWFLTSAPYGAERVIVPVLNIPREDLELRRDTQYLLDLLGIDEQSLLFVDEVPLAQLAEEGRLRLHLVDHNAVAVTQSTLADSVVSIIDHHHDWGVAYPLIADPDPQLLVSVDRELREIRVVGSASSLIALDFYRRDQDELGPDWAALLLGPVLLDTANLLSTNKTTERDLQAGAFLVQAAGEIVPDDFYDRLSDARSDTAGFTPRMLLRKDMKRYTVGTVHYTISGLPGGVVYDWVNDPALIEAVQQLHLEEDACLAMVLAMPAFDEEAGEVTRLLHIHATNMDVLNAAIECILDTGVVSDVSAIYLDADARMATIAVLATISRKTLQPQFQLDQDAVFLSLVGGILGCDEAPQT